MVYKKSSGSYSRMYKKGKWLTKGTAGGVRRVSRYIWEDKMGTKHKGKKKAIASNRWINKMGL